MGYRQDQSQIFFPFPPFLILGVELVDTWVHWVHWEGCDSFLLVVWGEPIAFHAIILRYPLRHSLLTGWVRAICLSFLAAQLIHANVSLHPTSTQAAM